ncbi:MAG: YafY family transcriptional regulator [Clostridiaceae bacterium]|nr:YafY family transcriptional regulator [Clostridiaceae bacterium]
MKLDRLVSILVLLLRKEKVQAKELAELFEVSVRTIYRDIEAINLAGIPIVTYQGVNGGIGIAEGYRLDKSVLTEDEMSTIVSTLSGIAPTMPDKKYEIIMKKIRNTIPSKQLENMDSKVKQLIIDFFPWGSGKLLKESISIIKKAIEKHNLIQFNYIDFSANKTVRTVEPYSLVLKGQNWYLRAWCQIRQDLRIFKLSRIKDLTALQDKFEPRKIEFDHINFDTEWKYTGKTVTLQLLFDGEIENIAFEYFGDSLEKQNDGKLLLKTVMPEGYWLYGFILSFGTGVEVIDPPHIRMAIADISKKIYKKYSSEGP